MQHPYSWKPKHTLFSLEAAIELDNLRLRRENSDRPLPDFNKIYAITGALAEHQHPLAELAANKKVYYDLFHNPLIETLKQFYGVSLEDYREAKRTLVSDITADLKTGLDQIIDSFEALDQTPTTFPIKEINALRDFCLTLSHYELACREQLQQYYLAAA